MNIAEAIKKPAVQAVPRAMESSAFNVWFEVNDQSLWPLARTRDPLTLVPRECPILRKQGNTHDHITEQTWAQL